MMSQQRQERPKPTLLRKWIGTPTDLELAVLYVVLGIHLVVASDAVIPFPWLGFVNFSVFLVILLAVARIPALLFALRASGANPVWHRWIQLAVILCLFTIIICTNLDLALRVRISESGLMERVERLRSASAEVRERMVKMPPRPVGLFNARVWEIGVGGRAIWFHTADGDNAFPPPYGLLGGIVYCEEGPPPERGETTYQHLYGPWWRWIQDT